MTIDEYLKEMEYAVSAISKAIWTEWDTAEALSSELQALNARVAQEYARSADMQQYGETADDVMEGVGRHWETYFGADKTRSKMQKSADELTARLESRRFSVRSLSGNLLQYAKQGISLVHASLQSCPDGRIVAGQALKNIIWQGRNQAMHWEEGNFHPAVLQCFDALKGIDPSFAAYQTQNMAFDIVRVIGWKTFDDFQGDMRSLQ